ncbi:transaldolase [Psychrobacter ciconiae]|uniref:transaldolase n=1 Tax=Psychrobacter ciconiae TaxID=1553449 RepID=UPI001919E373|nr:transaldolase [Psychrobacter ciconiae]
MSALDQLSTMTTIVADTGDLSAIARLKPVDATTNPSLITKALIHPDNQAMLSDTMNRHQGDVDAVIDALTVQIGCDILALIDGRVSTEVDARLSYDTQATIDKALEFIDAYQKAGIDPERILIKMAATWQGIEAARYLESQGIHCNLTLLFGQHQAIACADAGVTLISPFVGRILDWQKSEQNRQNVPAADDMGVQSVKLIYQYYKQHGYKTQVMGASFRSVEQILALAGCDLLTISPDLIDELAHLDTNVTRQLSPDMVSTNAIGERLSLTETAFNQAYQEDKVTQALLPKGIDGFISAREELAQTLAAIRN